jgi:hypothetical protein
MLYFECQSSIPARGTGQVSSPGSGKEGSSVGEVSTERTEKAGFAVLVPCGGAEGAKIPGFSMKQADLSGRNPMRGGVSEASKK